MHQGSPEGPESRVTHSCLASALKAPEPSKPSVPGRPGQVVTLQRDLLYGNRMENAKECMSKSEGLLLDSALHT